MQKESRKKSRRDFLKKSNAVWNYVRNKMKYKIMEKVECRQIFWKKANSLCQTQLKIPKKSNAFKISGKSLPACCIQTRFQKSKKSSTIALETAPLTQKRIIDLNVYEFFSVFMFLRWPHLEVLRYLTSRSSMLERKFIIIVFLQQRYKLYDVMIFSS